MKRTDVTSPYPPFHPCTLAPCPCPCPCPIRFQLECQFIPHLLIGTTHLQLCVVGYVPSDGWS